MQLSWLALIILGGSLFIAGAAQSGEFDVDCCNIDAAVPASPNAQADGLNGDDLDSRVSELEAASKKNRSKVSLTRSRPRGQGSHRSLERPVTTSQTVDESC